jgi:AcrR family transcriptional regulator
MECPFQKYVEGAFQMSTPGSGGSRRADAVRNRQAALDAATALLARPGAALTVEAIAREARLGAGTVVRAFGGKDALVDAAVAGLLDPVIRRAEELLTRTAPEEALRTFLAELIAFQTAHDAVNEQLAGLDLPLTTARREQLAGVLDRMIGAARDDGTVRADIAPGLLATLVGQTAYAVARARPASPELTDAFVTVLMDGLRRPGTR